MKNNKSISAFKEAIKVGKKASMCGFDWDDAFQVFKKCLEEFDELEMSISAKDREKIMMEFGDVLFALCNLARHLNINPEVALIKATNRFIKRFRVVEKYVRKSGRSWDEFTIQELDKFWDIAKSQG